MCSYTLHHNKMLASTMQHSTHNHTPTPRTTTTPTRTSHRDALDGPGQEQPYQRTTPTRCLLRTQQCAKLQRSSGTAVVLCSTQPHPPRTRRRVQRDVESVIRKTRHGDHPPEGRRIRAGSSHQHGETP